MTAADTVSTRRALLKGGALLAAPLAAGAATAAIADDGHRARLARLEDEAAIRDLHQAWLRRINTGVAGHAALDKAIRSLATNHAGESDAIEVAADGQTAAGRFHYTVEIETEIPKDSTLAQMAHAQGGGLIRHTERRVLRVAYVKASGVWAMGKVEFSAV